MKAIVMVFVASLVVPAMGGGAFATLWAVDVENEAEGWDETLFQTVHGSLGLSTIIMVCSHPSQHWFGVWAMWKHASMADISDVFTLKSAQRPMVFMGYFCFLYLMWKLWPVLTAPAARWCETIIQSNDMKNEKGVNVAMRHSFDPTVWWNHCGCESIPRGPKMMQCFWTITLPKLRVWDVYAIGKWKPYYQAFGPLYFVFMPKHGMPKHGSIKKELFAMWVECDVQRKYYGDDYGVPMGFLRLMKEVYGQKFVQGRWLTKREKKMLCPCTESASAAYAVQSYGFHIW